MEESIGDMGELSFFESYSSEVEGIRNAPPLRLDSGLIPVSSSPLVYADIRGEEKLRDDVNISMTNVGVSRVNEVSGSVLEFLEPHVAPLVWKAARLVSTKWV